MPEAQATVADAAAAQAALEEIPAEALIDNPVELAVEAAMSAEKPVPVEAAVVGTSPAPAPAPGRRAARADVAHAGTPTLDPVASDLKPGDRPAAAPAAPAAATAGRSDLPAAPAVLADTGAEMDPATPDAAAAAPGLQASAEAPVEAAPTRGSPETVARLAADIARKLEGKTTRFDVQLDPLGLGKVDVSIEINADGRLTASLSFDSSQTAADLRGRAGELRQALEAAGFDLAEGGLSFDMNNPGGSGGREARESLAAWSSRAFDTARSGLEQAEALAVRSPWSRAPSGGVDIRI
jgi:flagellar hook-length control protein FliK